MRAAGGKAAGMTQSGVCRRKRPELQCIALRHFPSTLAKELHLRRTVAALLAGRRRPVAPALQELPSIRDVIDGLILK